MVAAIIDRVGGTVLPRWVQPLRMVPMATTATTMAAITTNTASGSVPRSPSTDAADGQGGGFWPPSGLRFGEGPNSSAAIVTLQAGQKRPLRREFRDFRVQTSGR